MNRPCARSYLPIALLVVPSVTACGAKASPPAAGPCVAPAVTGSPPVASTAVAPAPTIDRDFMRLYADTRGFSRGAPRDAKITPDGLSVLFLRSASRDKKQSLFEMDIASGSVRMLVDPDAVGGGPEELSLEERARRERMRITANGLTAFDLSKDGKTLVTSLAGKLYAVDRASGKTRPIDTGKGAVIDPRLSPDGKLVAYVQDDDVHVTPVDGSAKPRAVTHGGIDDKPHGLADFAASEEFARFRGYWWAPNSKSILYEESDATKLDHFTIADPAHPEKPADRVAYPRAGTDNAVLRFGIVAVGGGPTTWIDWDRGQLPYVANVVWDEGAPPCLVVLDRVQKDESVRIVDLKTGKTHEGVHEHDDAWVNSGGHGDTRVPRWLPDGSAFLWWSERDGDERIGLVSARDASNVKWLTPAGTQARALLDVDPVKRAAVVETTRDALHYQVQSVSLDGGDLKTIASLDDGAVRAGFDESHDIFLAREVSLSGVHRLVVRSTDGKISREVPSVAEPAPVPHIEMEDVGAEHMHVSMVRPRSFVPGARYPLIDSAYAGPGVQLVELDARSMVLEQWMADSTGAIVVSIDAKGTPGRGRAWERALAGKIGDVPLEGHVEAVRALVAAHPEIDGSRVGVFGWSFGGYFSGLAILRRPDVYSTGVAIAPVTDWRNYDTAYTERYLGLPDANAGAYDAASLIAAAKANGGDARSSTLLVAHGTADDNVYFFNSLELVDAMAKAGRPFTFLPFTGQTHQFASADAQAAVWSAAAEAFQKGFSRP